MNSAKRSYKLLFAAAAFCLAVILAGCGTETLPAGTEAAGVEESKTPGTDGETGAGTAYPESGAAPFESSGPENDEETNVEKTLKLFIDGREMPITWLENDSVDALKEIAANGLTVRTSMYGGFEQVGSLGAELPRDDTEIVTDFGDVVLYSGNQIVIFYGSNSWSYTRLGHIDLSEAEMTGLLSNGDVNVALKYE